jgi:acylphosphatase
VIARRLRIHGRVQGVGFRDAMVAAARALGVAGWVRNRRDGTVEARVQGDDAAVADAIAWAHRGPPASRVERVDVESAEVDASVTRFDQAPTA